MDSKNFARRTRADFEGGGVEPFPRLVRAHPTPIHLVSGGIFTTRELHPETLKALGATPETYKLGSLRYDLSKLRAKGLVEKLPHSHRYRLLANGYQICLVYLKLFHRIYAPLTAGILDPFPSDCVVSIEKMTELDRLYVAVSKALDNLCEAVGLKAA